MDKKNYRRGVGMIIINNQGRFWLGKRIGTEAWQFPQGGIDKGERVRSDVSRASRRDWFGKRGRGDTKYKQEGAGLSHPSYLSKA